MVMVSATERDAVAALLHIQMDLSRTLRQQPRSPAERLAWRDAISTMLIEAARGRVYLADMQARRKAAVDFPQELAS